MSATRSPVGIVATNSVDFVRKTFEVLGQGRIAVPLRDADDQERIGIAKVTEVLEPRSEHGWASWDYTPQQSDAVAQFLFTSGTEGRPKGVELTHRALFDMVERLNGLMGVTSEIREYVGIPVVHSFGFGRCRAVATAGGRAYLPEHGFDPLEVADLLRKGEINAISAVPSLWRVLLEARSMFEDIGEGIRWIEIGSQYMSRDEKIAVRELFPKATIVQHYGLTEASRSTFLEVHDTDGDALESVGKAHGEVEVALTDDGRIKIRGPHVARRLWIDGEPKPAVDAQGWYETQDLGSIREGFVYFGGRADDLINCGGTKLSPEVLEAHARQVVGPGAQFSISRKPDPMRGDGILISIPHDAGLDVEALRRAVVEAAQEQGVQARGAIDTMMVEALPRTGSGKVQRRKLTEQWVSAHPEPEAPAAAAPAALSAAAQPEHERVREELRSIWKEALGIEDIGLDESFYDLGGDSLTALNVIMRMGRAGIDPAICRSIFQGATIAELAESLAPEPAPEASGGSAQRDAALEELRQIWQEALGQDDIGLDESFYDLGGDSLTALNVIMRMGRAGIDPAICRSIFQGATIRQLADSLAPEVSPSAAAPSQRQAQLDAKVAELQQIWKDALGQADIGLDESFYDLGGDSLTALNVIMRMGRAGIDPAICRSIFQGATIRQLAEASTPQLEAAPDAPATAAEAAPRTQATAGGLNLGYANNLVVNAVRGVLMFFVVAGHWSSALFSRLPESFGIVAKLLAPLFSFGTPGFAVTFGVGLGYLQLPIFERNPNRVKASMRTSLLIVGSGTALLGVLAMLGRVFIGREPFGPNVFFVSFYSPLLFYTLGVATVPLWFSLTTRVTADPKHRMRFLLGLAAGSAVIQMGLDVALADVEVTGFLQLARLMLEAKFAYFDMMSLVFVGLALGTYIKHNSEAPGAPQFFLKGGLLVIAVALVFGAITGEYVELTYWPSKNCLTKWVFYVGLVMVTISLLMSVTRRYASLSGGAQRLLKIASTVGQLSLVFYILAALPIPLKSMLELVGVPGALALLASLAFFLGVSYVLVKRVYSLIHN
ncbi:MAG: phosphopantetheine-binding protein [Nannocystaceae bacterium]|nr:AMP-binding protein [bacterium]